jgi:hypothetical protein
MRRCCATMNKNAVTGFDERNGRVGRGDGVRIHPVKVRRGMRPEMRDLRRETEMQRNRGQGEEFFFAADAQITQIAQKNLAD